MVWTKIDGFGEPPTPRYDHTCTFLNGFLFVIGGIDNNKRPAQYRSNVGIFNLGMMMSSFVANIHSLIRIITS